MTLEGVRFKTVRPAAAYLEVLMGYQIKLVNKVPNSIELLNKQDSDI